MCLRAGSLRRSEDTTWTLTQVPETKAEREFLDWLRRAIEGKTYSKWRPLEGADGEISKGVSCEGWFFTKNQCRPQNSPRG